MASVIRKCCCGSYYPLLDCDTFLPTGKTLSPSQIAAYQAAHGGATPTLFLSAVDLVCYSIGAPTAAAGSDPGSGVLVEEGCSDCTINCTTLATAYPDTYTIVEDLWSTCPECSHFAAPYDPYFGDRYDNPPPPGPGVMTRESLLFPGGSEDVWSSSATGYCIGNVHDPDTCTARANMECTPDYPSAGSDTWFINIACSTGYLFGGQSWRGTKTDVNGVGAAGTYNVDGTQCAPATMATVI